MKDLVFKLIKHKLMIADLVAVRVVLMRGCEIWGRTWGVESSRTFYRW